MNNTKVFKSTWALQQLPLTMKLYPIEWRFLLCSDGKTPVYQIQRLLGLSDREQESVLARLCESGLLTEKTLSLEEYARTTVDLPSAETEPQTLPDYLRSSDAAESSRGKNLPTFSPLQKPPVTTVHAMSLQSVIQFILSQNPDPTAGQLATYRVFMGINTQLLKRNGITSLRFQDDRLITDPELQAAIATNIQKVLNVNCPEEVFSRAA
jgi:hypothetical protein